MEGRRSPLVMISVMNERRWKNISSARNAYLEQSHLVDAYPIEAVF